MPNQEIPRRRMGPLVLGVTVLLLVGTAVPPVPLAQTQGTSATTATARLWIVFRGSNSTIGALREGAQEAEVLARDASSFTWRQRGDQILIAFLVTTDGPDQAQLRDTCKNLPQGGVFRPKCCRKSCGRPFETFETPVSHPPCQDLFPQPIERIGVASLPAILTGGKWRENPDHYCLFGIFPQPC